MEVFGEVLTAELVLDAHAELGEGPVWDAERGLLWWVDILGQRVHGFDPGTGEDVTFDTGSPVGAVTLTDDGRLLLALARGLALLNPETGAIDAVSTFEPSIPPLRCNDAKCDPRGRLWVGRMTPDAAAGAGSLVRIDADLRSTTRLTGLTIPNGLGWTGDGRQLYFLDSKWGDLRVFDYDVETGEAGPGRSVLRFPDDGGSADGLTVDAEDHVWVARWGARGVIRIAPDGRIVQRISVPASQVTSCTFGGEHLDELYITTASEFFTPADHAREPQAGALYRVRPGVRGRHPDRWRVNPA